LLTGSWENVRRPFVVIDGGPDDHSSPRRADIRCDAAAIGRLAAQTLRPLGATSYAFVPGFPPDEWSSRRGDAFLAVLRDFGAEPWAFTPLCRDRESGHLDAECSRLAEWLASLPRPVAVFAANDAVATFVYTACRRARLTIPDDVYVLGVDNDETVCAWSRPTLSSILVDFESCGRQAAELLDSLLLGRRGSAGRRLTFKPLSVVHRASTRPRIPQANVRLARALDIVDRDACHGLTVSGLARTLAISRRSLELLFLPLGETPAHCLAEARLRSVRDRLLSTSLPITRIAADCGFPSVVYLAGLFKRRYGCTMSAFRKRKRNGPSFATEVK
jgi:LacI family transcriptional regulator